MVVGALPLAAVAGLALGVVLWMHTRDVLARTGTGAVDYETGCIVVGVD